MFTIAALSIIFIIVIHRGIRYLEQKSLYFPCSNIESTPTVLGMSYKDINITSSDGCRIHGWIIGEGNRPLILYCHGNGGNIGQRVSKIKLFTDLGFDILAFDYRGYGNSNGIPKEKGLYQDCRAMRKYAINELGYLPGKLVIYGESLGGAVATRLASEETFAYLIIEDSFTSVPAMAKKIYTWMPSWVLNQKYNSLDSITRVNCPKLIYHSKDDEIIPYQMGKELYQAANDPRNFIELIGSHNSAYFDSLDIWTQGLKEVLHDISKPQKN